MTILFIYLKVIFTLIVFIFKEQTFSLLKNTEEKNEVSYVGPGFENCYEPFKAKSYI